MTEGHYSLVNAVLFSRFFDPNNTKYSFGGQWVRANNFSPINLGVLNDEEFGRAREKVRAIKKYQKKEIEAEFGIDINKITMGLLSHIKVGGELIVDEVTSLEQKMKFAAKDENYEEAERIKREIARIKASAISL
jgi:hypothetical protein